MTGPFWWVQEHKIRLQYCEDGTPVTNRTVPWYEHMRLDGRAPRRDEGPLRYETKPMVSIGWPVVEALCAHLSTATVRYRLPTEAEWEKAARGGLVQCRYPWGNDPPTPSRCDCNHFGRFGIARMRKFPPNGYGLSAMSGGVWEWTSDWYDAEAYARRAAGLAPVPVPEHGRERVLRGGSWADCPEAVTVSFRMSQKGYTSGGRSGCPFPNVGFRLVRVEA